MLNFCTLFNSNYSAKGLAMYESLCRVCEDFHLYIFAFDEKLTRALRTMDLPFVTVVPLEEFEDDELLRIKPTRTAGEYCWTCSSCSIYYCIKRFGLDHCTYIDADLYFFADPQVLLDEMGNDDVLITRHRYTPIFDQSETSGIYCVQFVSFKNTERGMTVLSWWRRACLDWCYNRAEDGKFGDQKYLDDWTTRFDGVHDLIHLGGGVAPWNVQQYRFVLENGEVCGTELSTGKKFPLIFFHFHGLAAMRDMFFCEFHSLNYPLPASARKRIYIPYLSQLKSAYKRMLKIDASINGIAAEQTRIPVPFLWLKHNLKWLIYKDNKYFY